ncbi:hypothetical protein JMJ35_006182 [Cladonia borealis]|uniref:RNA helicase n=1 Tax=Cladonia borealis TaxID=184061 RepID=A0AA39R0Z2_9LECA|nr:hypothetical protein JMJ35_006182 [Cladonia borealis]
MKRKLNDDDVPTAVSVSDTGNHASSFSTLGLDPRLLQAVAKENFSSPTLVQAKAIPLALEGKDILARSKTGSGKTAAYILPILQSILQKKAASKHNKSVSALILVPTRELAQQVSKVIATFSAFCSKDVRTINLTQKVPDAVQRTLLAESPDIVVATPARAAQNLQSSALSVNKLAHLVIDEADLVLSYGYEDDLQTIADAVPKGVQTFLMSATLTTEVNDLKGLFCRDPIILDFQESASDSGGVSQYVVHCAEDEKFLLIYVIFKLQLIKGKCIIFVGDVDRSYRLKLFFEQFGIRSCVLNSELPVNSRIHVVEEFNKNVYDIIIASDEHEVLDVREEKSDNTEQEMSNAADGTNDEANDPSIKQTDDTAQKEKELDKKAKQTDKPKQPRRRSKKSKEYGVSRGIDFQNVASVINFDLPVSSKSYTHRIGRTARAGKTGMALSFVVPAHLYKKHKPTTFPTAEHDEEVLKKISSHQQKKGKEVKPYHFDMKQVDAFRYRMNDALRAVTRIAIREARTRELRQELLKSEKLKRHFEENPEDLHHLRHDGELRAARIQPHLRHVPDYLMPSNGKQGIVGQDIGFVGLRKTTDNRIRRARMQNRMKGKGKKATVLKLDPLKTFNAKGRGRS